MTKQRYTADEIYVRVWAITVFAITLILFGIVASLLYSVTFVVQPIKSMAPIDQAYTKMLNDIVLLIVGGIGGVVGKSAIGQVANRVAPPPPPPMQPMCQTYGNPMQPAPFGGLQSNYNAPQQPYGMQPYGNGQTQAFGGMPVWVNPPLDESWTPPPPPTTPPDHLEPDDEREILAAARAEVQNV